MRSLAERIAMAGYSLLLAVALVLSAPWWLWRMLTQGRYRAGLAQRLGRVPPGLIAAARGRRVVWLHAVSVGEVLAATRLVAELEARLGEGWCIVISTTTATGQALARERFATTTNTESAGHVFFYPLDFAWAVRPCLNALKPDLLVLMESELWPRMISECARRGIPVAVVNARVSDRSFARGLRLRPVWGRMLRRVSLFLAQSDEDAQRLVAMGALAKNVRTTGNLKYDVRAPQASSISKHIREVAAGRPVVVAGSTVGGHSLTPPNEESMLLNAWRGLTPQPLLVLAPRHPERFSFVSSVIDVPHARASDLAALQGSEGFTVNRQVVVLDTIGDLAAVYGIANIAFVGGSLLSRGGHNPLEPAQFGVPVVIGPSFENFRDIVGTMQADDGIRIVQNEAELAATFKQLLTEPAAAKSMGERGRAVFASQSGAAARTVDALVELLQPTRKEAAR